MFNLQVVVRKLVKIYYLLKIIINKVFLTNIYSKMYCFASVYKKSAIFFPPLYYIMLNPPEGFSFFF